MNKILILCAVLTLTACGRKVEPEERMSNDAIISETKKCEAAGLDAVAYSGSFGGYVYRVDCQPRRTEVRIIK